VSSGSVMSPLLDTSLYLPLSSPPSTQILHLLFSHWRSTHQEWHIYSTDGKCQGMITMMVPERLNIPQTAIHKANLELKGLRDNMRPAPKGFASELASELWLLAR